MEPRAAGPGERAVQGAARAGASAPTAGCITANTTEFIAALDYLLDHPDAARTLGRQGLAYVDREYRWPIVMDKIERLLAQTG